MAVKFKPAPVIPSQDPTVQLVAPAGVLTIWTEDPKAKVLAALGPVLKADPSFPVVVNNDFTKYPEGNCVLVLGGAGKELLETLKVVRKNATINALRNQVWSAGDKRLLVSYSAGISDVDYAKYVDLLCDAKSALRLAKTGSAGPVMGTYQWVNDFAGLIAGIEAQFALTQKPVDVAFDSETRGADPFHGDARFVTLQFSSKPGTGQAVFFASPEEAKAACAQGSMLWHQMTWLLTSPKVSLRVANAKFDLVWCRKHLGIECTNFRFDTTLVGGLLDENRSNSLDVHAKVYTDLGGYSDEFDLKVDKSRMDLLPKNKELLDYACGDTDACLQASVAMKTELLKDPRLTGFYVHVLHSAARAFEVIEHGGVFVDIEAYNELEFVLRAEMDKLVAQAVNIMGGRIFAKHMDPTKPGGINLTKASLLVDFMFGPMGLNLKPKMMTETGKPATSYEHLMMFKDVPEAAAFVSIIDEYSSAAKTLGTYVLGFREHLRDDGRFHPSYFLHKGNQFNDDGGTVTGRLSAKNPAFQTIPKHTKWGKMLRRVFKAPPGYVILERDYSQGELRVVACIADEKTMIQAYKEGKDLHVLTGSFIIGKSYEEVMALEKTDPEKFDAIRQPGKPANFGLLYGQSAAGFQGYAESNYGVKMSLEEAEHNRTRFFNLYPALPTYHQVYKDYAHKHGYVRSPLGRLRHLPLVNSKDRMTRSSMERKAINSPVQSTLSDLMIWALGIENAEGGFKVAPCFGVVHDAAYDYVPEDKVDVIVKHKRELMENLPMEKLGWKPQLKFIADCKVGPDMATLKKVKAAA